MNEISIWVSLITAIGPGMALILNGFGTPEEMRQPFGILAGACGFAAFGVVLFVKESFKRRRKKNLALFVIGFGLIGFLSLCSYWIVLDQCVMRAPERSPAFFPLWLDSPAKENVENVGGRMAYYERYGPGAVAKLLETQTTRVFQTKVLLLALISVASLALPVATGLASAVPRRRSRSASTSGGEGQSP
jgi:H+/Cl- antiporter ClcA